MEPLKVLRRARRRVFYSCFLFSLEQQHAVFFVNQIVPFVGFKVAQFNLILLLAEREGIALGIQRDVLGLAPLLGELFDSGPPLDVGNQAPLRG